MSAIPNEYVKTFSGRTVEEVTAQVKSVLGIDAIVLNKREKPKSKFKLGGEAENLVEIDAVPARVANQFFGSEKESKAGGSSLVSRVYGSNSITGTPKGNSAAPPPLHRDNDLISARPTAILQPAPSPTVHAELSADLLTQMQTLMQAELQAQQTAMQAAMRNEVLRLTSDLARGGAPLVGERYLNVYDQLLENGVNAALARELVEKLQNTLGLDRRVDENFIIDSLRITLANEFAVASPLSLPLDKSTRTIALIGPSGAGKTTTVVKMAFSLALKQQVNVALITEDVHRPEAATQLMQMARMMNIPTTCAYSPQQIEEEIQNYAAQGVRVVIVDTGGRATRDQQSIDDLAEKLHAARPVETHLVIPATIAEKSARAYAEKYKVCNYNRLLISKIDEAEDFGLLLNLTRCLPVAFSYLASGQGFRDGLLAPTRETLAQMVIDKLPRLP